MTFRDKILPFKKSLGPFLCLMVYGSKGPEESSKIIIPHFLYGQVTVLSVEALRSQYSIGYI